MDPNETRALFRTVLDRLVRAEGTDDYETVAGGIDADLAAVPNAPWAVEALKRAVGKSKSRKNESCLIIAVLADRPVFESELMKLVSDPDPRARSTAVQVLSQRHNPHVAGLLGHIMEHDEDMRVRTDAIIAARTNKSEETLGSLIRLARAEIEKPSDLEWYLIWTFVVYADERGAFYLKHIFEKYKDSRDELVDSIRDKFWAKNRMKHCVIAADGLYRITHSDEYMAYLESMLDDCDIHHDTGFIPGVAHWAARAICEANGTYDPNTPHDELIERAKKLTSEKYTSY